MSKNKNLFKLLTSIVGKKSKFKIMIIYVQNVLIKSTVRKNLYWTNE